MSLNLKDTAQEAQAPQPEAVVLLELALYERYNRAGVLYTQKTEDGKPRAYRFKLSDARVLLREVEEGTGRPIWVRAKPKAQVTTDPREADEVAELAPIQAEGSELSARVDVGSAEELAELGLGDDEVQV